MLCNKFFMHTSPVRAGKVLVETNWQCILLVEKYFFVPDEAMLLSSVKSLTDSFCLWSLG